MKIYDCFTFFNELDLLEIRLNELHDVVDYFVLVEATFTFQNKPKPLYYEENKQRFSTFSSKIIHIVVQNQPDTLLENESLSWTLEKYQRHCIERGLKDSDASDIIMISDIDEIPKREKVIEAVGLLNKYDAILFMQDYFLYYLNMKEKRKEKMLDKFKYFTLSYFGFKKYFTKSISYLGWPGTVMISKSKFENAQATREIWKLNTNFHTKSIRIKPLLKGGWHFSFLGGTEAIIRKLESFAHTEFNTEEFKNPERIEKLLLSNKTILDSGASLEKVNESTLPEYVIRNKDTFAKLFI